MQNLLISIIVPIYNAEKYIIRSLDSIKNQTYRNIEVLLIDDGSTDNSKKIVDEYIKTDWRFRVLHIPNGGVSHARNVGLDNFHGEYVCFVDADDIIDPNYVEHLLYAIKKENTLMSRCILKYAYNSNLLVSNNEINTKPFRIDVRNEFDYTKKYAHAAVYGGLYNKKLVKSIRFDEDIFIGEDNLFVARIIDKCDFIAVIEEPLYIYIYYEDSANHCTYNEKHKTDIISQNRIIEIFKMYPFKFKVSLYAKYCKICCTHVRRIDKSVFGDIGWRKYVFSEARKSFPYLLISNYRIIDKIAYSIHMISPKFYDFLYTCLKKQGRK